MDLEQRIEDWSKQAEPTYIFYGNQEALDLFDSYSEDLFNSECFDYHIAKYQRYHHTPELLKNVIAIEGYRKISEEIYKQLHLEICNKLGALLRKKYSKVDL